jgi:tetratricopeptide (TPR) repeat protein
MTQDMRLYRFRLGDGYTSGLDALQRHQYDEAISAFDRVAAAKGAHRDGALYWKAFAQFKQGRTAEALETIASLRRDFPRSRYLEDARVLEADVRRAAGQPVNPATINDDDIKLLAIQGLQQSQEAIPLLEGVLNATNSLAVKRRALYVLALSSDPRAHALLLRYAKGGGNPDLQVEAIRYLVSRRDGTTSTSELRDIYASTEDTSVRLAIIDALASPQNADALVALGRQETNPQLKTDIVQRLSALAPKSEAASAYLMEILKAK